MRDSSRAADSAAAEATDNQFAAICKIKAVAKPSSKVSNSLFLFVLGGELRANYRGYQFRARQARSEPALEKLPAFRTELNGVERSERIAGVEKYVARKEFAPELWFWVCRTQRVCAGALGCGISHAVVCRVMHGRGARHTTAGNILHHIRKLRSTPFTPFLSVQEPSVFSRRTSVAWRTRALITVGYQFRARLGVWVCCTRIVCNSVMERGAQHFLSTVFLSEKAQYFFFKTAEII